MSDLPYKKGIQIQNVIDQMYESDKERCPDLTKQLMEKMVLEEYAKMKTAHIENGMLYRIEKEPTDTFLPFEWLADLVQKHVPVSYEIAEAFNFTKEQADQERYSISGYIVAHIESTLRHVYYERTDRDETLIEVKKEEFEQIMYKAGGQRLQMMLGDKKLLLDLGDDGKDFKHVAKKCIDEVKAQIYSRLDDGHTVTLFDELSFKKSNDNIKIVRKSHHNSDFPSEELP